MIPRENLNGLLRKLCNEFLQEFLKKFFTECYKISFESSLGCYRKSSVEFRLNIFLNSPSEPPRKIPLVISSKKMYRKHFMDILNFFFGNSLGKSSTDFYRNLSTDFVKKNRNFDLFPKFLQISLVNHRGFLVKFSRIFLQLIFQEFVF